MILDSLDNSARFESLHPLFKQAFDYLKTTDFSTLADGKYTPEGLQITISIATITGKDKSDSAIETHQKYIDIQTPLLGVEKIGWKPGGNLAEISVPYHEENDITFYADRSTAHSKIYPGQFAIYFPEDGHAPGIGAGSIRKVVVKIPV